MPQPPAPLKYALDYKKLGVIKPWDIELFARIHGWETTGELFGYGSATARVYRRRQDDASIEMLIPTTRDIGDYRTRVKQLIEILALYGDMDEAEIGRRIYLMGYKEKGGKSRSGSVDQRIFKEGS